MSWLRRGVRLPAVRPTVEAALSRYDRDMEAAAARLAGSTQQAQRRRDTAATRAAAALRRAEAALTTATGEAGEQHQREREAALDDLDAALKEATGAHPSAHLRVVGSETRLHVDDFGPPVVQMGSAGGQWYVDTSGGRTFCGSFAQARVALWTAVRPPAGTAPLSHPKGATAP